MNRKFIIILFFFIFVACNRSKENLPEYKPTISNSIGMTLNYIPPGTFMMGPKNEYKLGVPGEVTTQHKVTLTKGFYMQTTETTVGHWKRFIEATGYKTQAEKDGYVWLVGFRSKRITNGSWFKPGYKYNENFPVTMISWEDSQQFVKWLNKKTNKKYRLPTEAEWEYACRAGTTTHFVFGNLETINNIIDARDNSNKKLGEYAWYGENSYGVPHEVGIKKANPWGVFDMYGNVSEFCIDYYRKKYQSFEVDPVNLKKTSGRVIKGGGTSSQSFLSTSYIFNRVNPKAVSNLYGFRIVKEVDKSDLIEKEEKK